MHGVTIVRVLGALILLSLIFGVCAGQADLIKRKPDESDTSFAQRILPPGMKLAHSVVRGEFGPGRNNLVILFHSEDYKPYAGWVLVEQSDGFRKLTLPVPDDIWSFCEVQAVFFTRIPGSSTPELMILCEHMTGIGPTGAVPFNYTWVYQWDGQEFLCRRDLSDRIGDKKTAAQVRQRLQKLSK